MSQVQGLQGSQTMSKHNLSAQEFAALLRWKMVSDPFPGEPLTEDRITEMLNREAESRNYDDWVHAYHELH